METYNGHVRTPQDAITLFEACRIGLLPRVQRRLSEKERQQIKSGSVFVWDEREAGMRRWTDGKSWSASRVSGSFLTYREMEGKRGGSFPTPAPAPKRPSGKSPDGSATGESDGEGPDGYRYKPDGLMKQSFSITTSTGQHLHLISYFSRSHSGNLQQPTNDTQLRHIRAPKNMYPETTVHESNVVPAVTRSPIPNSPYAPSPQQMGQQASPYPRPGPPQQPQPTVYVPVYPPTPPSGTPPYQYAYYGHAPPSMQYGSVIYAQSPYHPQEQHLLNRPPPPIGNPHPPPGHAFHQSYSGYPSFPNHPGHSGYSGHPGHPNAHYNSNPPARAMQTTELPQQQAQANGHHHLPAVNPTLPEPGPQLPAINGTAPLAMRAENKPPTPQLPEPKSQESLMTPESNGAAVNNAPSPARTYPNLGSLLNHESGADGKSNQTNSRSGSRSPHSSQRPPRDLAPDRIASNSTSVDASAVNKLNAVMFVS